MLDQQNMTLDVTQSIEIEASPERTFETVIRRLTCDNTTPDNQPMPMVLEQWPGGRWYRDLGEQTGHLWGLVQVIKPPRLIEIQGPLFMSYPAAGHLQIRLAETESGTEMLLRHRVLGLIEDAHREAVGHGWNHLLTTVREAATSCVDG